MNRGLRIDFGVDQEAVGLGSTEWAFRYGLPFEGIGRPAGNAGASLMGPAGLREGILVKVDWLPEVSWEVEIRCVRLQQMHERYRRRSQ